MCGGVSVKNYVRGPVGADEFVSTIVCMRAHESVFVEACEQERVFAHKLFVVFPSTHFLHQKTTS